MRIKHSDIIKQLERIAWVLDKLDLCFYPHVRREKETAWPGRHCYAKKRPCCLTAYHHVGKKPSWEVCIHEYIFEDGGARWIDNWPVVNGTKSQVYIALFSFRELLGYMMHIQEIRKP